MAMYTKRLQCVIFINMCGHKDFQLLILKGYLIFNRREQLSSSDDIWLFLISIQWYEKCNCAMRTSFGKVTDRCVVQENGGLKCKKKKKADSWTIHHGFLGISKTKGISTKYKAWTETKQYHNKPSDYKADKTITKTTSKTVEDYLIQLPVILLISAAYWSRWLMIRLSVRDNIMSLNWFKLI